MQHAMTYQHLAQPHRVFAETCLVNCDVLVQALPASPRSFLLGSVATLEAEHVFASKCWAGIEQYST